MNSRPAPDAAASARTVVPLHPPPGRTAPAVVLNLADDPADVPLPRSGGRVALAWDPEGTTVTTDAVRLPGGSAAVVLW